MSAYLPNDPATAWMVAGILTATLLAGLAITRIGSAMVARLAAWNLELAGFVGVDLLNHDEPPGLRMLALIGVVLWGMKSVVTVEVQIAGQTPLPPLRWLAFAATWIGMRPAPFARVGGRPLPGAGRLLGSGLRNVAAGAGLIVLARLTWLCSPVELPDAATRILATIFLLPGLSLVLHFGIFNMLAGTWRLAGVDCRALFRAPLASRSLSEFWGRRWNLAFSEMTTLAVYRPLAGRLGIGAATFGAFLFSGVLHELAISVPVRAGYGLPLLYFAVHGLLVLVERWLERINHPIDRMGWLAHVWTLGWLGLPLPVLFRPYFLRGVVWPLVGIES